MTVRRLNHAVLYVRDVATSVAFYKRALGFEVVMQLPGAAFLRASGSTNDHDLGLFEIGAAAGPSGAGTSSVGLYHLAWEVETLAQLRDVRATLASMSALVGESDHSTTKSLYAHDPDGLEFEVCWIVPADRLDDVTKEGAASVRHLDLDAELARFGADTVGGLGVSWPVG
jgi:catechol-2,3-dioxygenase